MSNSGQKRLLYPLRSTLKHLENHFKYLVPFTHKKYLVPLKYFVPLTNKKYLVPLKHLSYFQINYFNDQKYFFVKLF
jgi:hypothetical protein